MPTPKASKGAHAPGDNRAPTYVVVEFAESDLEVRIQPERYNPSDKKPGDVVTLECTLTYRRFTAVVGALLYAINACNGALVGYLHPQTVAQGEPFIQDRLRYLAQLERDRSRHVLEAALRLEAAATLPVQFLLPVLEDPS